MSINLRIKNHIIYANALPIVDLRSPFKKVVLRTKLKMPDNYFRPAPITKLGTTTNVNEFGSYYCHIKGVSYAPFFKTSTTYYGGYKCYGIYKAVPKTKLLLIRALEGIVHNEISSQMRLEIINSLGKLINRICLSGGFDCVLTDCEILNCSNDIKVPIIIPNWKLIKPTPVIDNDPLLEFTNELIERYGPIPLSSIASVMNKLDINSTNIDLSILKKYKRVLILIGTNVYYTSYLRVLLINSQYKIDALPTVLFLVG